MEYKKEDPAYKENMEAAEPAETERPDALNAQPDETSAPESADVAAAPDADAEPPKEQQPADTVAEADATEDDAKKSAAGESAAEAPAEESAQPMEQTDEEPPQEPIEHTSSEESAPTAPAQEETVVRYRWNYETQRATDEQLSGRKRRRGIVTYAVVMTAFFAVSFAILIASLLTGGLTGRPVDAGAHSQGTPSDRIVYIREDDGESGVLTIQEIAEQSKSCVVAVTVRKTLGQGVGSGFILREDGYIATNYHVVENGTSVQVVLHDGESYQATVVNYSEPDDLAVLKIDASDLPVLPIGDSDEVLVGDDVVVIGHPAGLEYGWSTTNGILSAINREVKIKNADGTLNKKMTLLQTNANVNSGNSGGPMLNDRGEVIGIISMKLANGYEGMGFAIPINGAMEIMEAIIETGHADDVTSSVSRGRPVLGVVGTDVVRGYTIVLHDDGTSSAYPPGMVPENVLDGEEVYPVERSGFMIRTVNADSDAYGKLQCGDIIIGIDGTETENRAKMMAILDEKNVGDTAVIDYLRDGEIYSVKIKLSAAE